MYTYVYNIYLLYKTKNVQVLTLFYLVNLLLIQ